MSYSDITIDKILQSNINKEKKIELIKIVEDVKFILQHYN